MLFSLTNIKRRSVRDRDGELAIVPKLLHGRAMVALLGQAIQVFEGYLGRPRGEYDSRTLEAVMGDYRLGRCVEACLLTRYQFTQPSFETVLTSEEIGSLANGDINNTSDLRLAVWDAANIRHGGFVPPSERADFLSTLAQEWGLPADPALVDTLLALDAESSAVLTLVGERPTPLELMRLYNRGVAQTLLAHSTQVQFDAGHLPGNVLKRLYFVAKRRGVLVEIEQAAGGEGFTLTLFGPEQAFGSADKYGRRLAEVSLSLLRSILSFSQGESIAVGGTASLLLHDRPYRFHLTAEVLARLGYAPETAQKVQVGRVAEAGVAYSVGSAVEEQEGGGEAPSFDSPSFDSMVEARMYKEYKSLEKGGYTHGWLMQREPEPLLAPGVVLIPDFAFLRGGTRVFMEIAGFWSPSYKERKVAKLRSLAARPGATEALVLAVPQEAVATFSGLPFPVIPYKNDVRMTDVLTLLDAHYGGREGRAEVAQGQVARLQAAARERGLVPEKEVAETMQAYTRTELLNVARPLDCESCRYVAGVGLLSEAASRKLREELAIALGKSGGRISLEDATRLVSAALETKSIDVEALVAGWPEWRIERPSLFEVYLVGQ